MSSPPPSSDPRLTALAVEPYSAAELEARLDEILDPVLSTRRTATPLAQAAATLSRSEQDFLLHWTAVASGTNHELAYQFASATPAALAQFDLGTAEAWVIHAMDTYDREGLYRGSAVLKNPDEFAASIGDASNAQNFEEISRILELFVRGLSGRRMRLDMAAQPYTDTETLFLPPRLARKSSRGENFLLYKSIAAMLWAQSRYGTFNVDLPAVLESYPSSRRVLELFGYLETVRLQARIAMILPGLGRDALGLHELQPGLDPRVRRLCSPDAGAGDSLSLIAELYEDFQIPRPFLGVELRWDEAMSVRSARISREKAQFRASLKDLMQQQDTSTEIDGSPEGLTATQADSDEHPARELQLAGKQLPTPDHVRQLIDSIQQDLGNVPDDYLMPEGDRGHGDSAISPEHPLGVWEDSVHDERIYLYNEWDCGRRHYRKNWCVLRELDGHAADPQFVAATLVKYGPQVTQLKRTFELLRSEDRLLKRQPHGNDIDFDAVVSGYADMRNGMELSDRLLTRRYKAERDLAVMFMVDMSGSTKGWINDAEREALVMLCEALEVLGDRYAIYGFSGITRKRCEIYRIKRFEEPYDEQVQGRISGIRPQDYTRMGVAIRHLTARLNQVEARTKLLVTLSDGKPDDYSDNYRGEYGIEDTRRALIESHRSGIKPYCITIDREARDYLPHLYGPVSWTLVDEVSRLPLKVADIYRRLTS